MSKRANNTSSRLFKPVHELIHNQAVINPAAIALEQDGETMSYAELDASADYIAMELHNRGIGGEATVIVPGERSLQTIVAFLGILKAGCSYVPIDATTPPGRVSFIINDCGGTCVLGQAPDLRTVATLEGLVVLDIDDLLVKGAREPKWPVSVPVPENHRAYVIYTSGSTGTPKGVEIEHHSLVNLINFYRRRLKLGPTDRIPITTSIAFDVSVAQIWPTLASGATLCIPPEDLMTDTAGFVEWLADNRITITDTPTRLGEILFQENWPPDTALRTLLTGGAALRTRPPLNFPCPVINAYGPTENTVDSLWSVVTPAEKRDGSLPPIGHPIDNVQAYIVDENFCLVPDGAEGELVLGGENVARGYLNRPELTAERFVPDVFSGTDGMRLYRTGDKVRRREDGEIEFIGRLDDQIQLRGFRIELGEIECAILKHPDVKAVAVIPLPDATEADELAAYVEGLPQERLKDELRPILAKTLPEYMIPGTFTAMEAMPYNLSGKIDKKILPAPCRRDATAHPQEEITDELESRLADIWQALFGVGHIGLDDNFFDLGGTSLLILRLVADVRRKLGKKMTPAILLRAPTIRKLALRLRGQTDNRLPSCIMSMLDGVGSKSPLFCVSGGGGGAHWFYPLLPHLDPDRPFYVLDFLGLDFETNAHASVEGIAAIFCNAIKQVQPHGPYLLGGFSLGGTFAWELAQQLQAGGDEVPLLFLLDQYGPGIKLSFWPKLRQYIVNFLKLSWRDKISFFGDKYRWIKKNIKYAFAAGDIKEQEARHRLVMQSHINATNRYTPQIRDGILDIFVCEHPPRSAPPDKYAGWGGYATGGIRIHEIPGNHFSMFQPPNNRIFAEALEKCIQRAEAETVGSNSPP